MEKDVNSHEKSVLFNNFGHVFLSSYLQIVDYVSLPAPAIVLLMPLFQHSWTAFFLCLVGFFLCLGGILLRSYARRHLKGAFRLYEIPEIFYITKSGPYNYIRHPWYIANFVSVLGMSIAMCALPISKYWAAGLVLGTLFHILLLILIEESFLRKHFPQYSNYSKKVGAFIPAMR